MGTGYLIDSNTIIDFFNGKLPQKGKELMFTIEPVISIITQIEIFSKADISIDEFSKLRSFINIATIYPVDSFIALKTIDLRINYKIKLPDALIAATAVSHNLTLITRNIDDFKKIDQLKIIDPYNL